MKKIFATIILVFVILAITFIADCHRTKNHDHNHRISKKTKQNRLKKFQRKMVHHQKHKRAHKKTTTTTTTEAPKETEATREIRRLYDFGRNITNAYAFSFEQAIESFQSRLGNVVLPEFPSCNKTLPKFTKSKIRELQHILEKSACENGGSAGFRPKNQKHSNYYRHYRRRREAAMCQQMVRNNDGSESCVVMCRQKSSDSGGFTQTCTECDVITILPIDRYETH